MKIFLYEFVTGGGCWGLAGNPIPEGSLLHEGDAMWAAMGHDLSHVTGSHVVTTRDARLPPPPLALSMNVIPIDSEQAEREAFAELASASDVTLVIAPEFDSLLSSRIVWLEQAGCRHANASLEFIALTADKTRLEFALTAAGVRSPAGSIVAAGQPLPTDDRYPAVLKPNDGAGSTAVRLVADASAAQTLGVFTRDLRLERHVAGLACSVSFLCSPWHRVPLPPMEQRLSADGMFRYLGGRRIIDDGFVSRATRLASHALDALPPAHGYVGVDMVLGERPDGCGDYVIEINPRLTTSYLGLREIANTNLAEALLRMTVGEPYTVDFHDGPVDFLANGDVN